MIHGKELAKLQQTTNYKLNLIENSDKVLDSINKMNENTTSIDEELKNINDNIGKFETVMNDLIEGAGV